MKTLRLSDSEDRITEAGLESGSRLAPTNTVLLLVRGSELHKSIPIGITSRPVAFNQDVKALIPKPGVSPHFLLYWLLAHRDLLLSKVEHTGIGAGKLDTQVMLRLPVQLPPPSEQELITSFMRSIDDKIELNRRMNETLEAIARAMFKSWFVDFDPVRSKAEARQPLGIPNELATKFPSKFQSSPLGKIPEGWNVRSIRDLASNIQYGLTTSACSEPIGPKFLRITDIQGGQVDWEKVPHCRGSFGDQERYRLVAHDILVARTGASTGENIYLPRAPVSVFASYLVRFQFQEPALARFVGEFMRTPAYFDYISGCLGGSAQPNASAQVLAGAQMAVPNAELCARFFATVQPMDVRQAINREESATLAALRDELLPRLMRGEIRLKQAEKIVEVHA